MDQSVPSNLYSLLINETRNLDPVPLEASIAFHQLRASIIDFVNRRMAARRDIGKLTGHNPLEMIRDNHTNHANFMDNVFFLNHFRLIVEVVPWVYRVYQSRGFSPDYFPVVLAEWQDAIGRIIEPTLTEPLIRIYEWMAARHSEWLELSREWDLDPANPDADQGIRESTENFVQALLEGDSRRSLRIAREIWEKKQDLSHLYLKLITPAMQQIGKLWEQEAISVAQEHLASAIVTRIMAAMQNSVSPSPNSKGIAVVTSAPNEFHEIGAWMISDLLELRGWQVHYLGANIPASELICMLREAKPDLLIISVIMPFNFRRVSELIRKIRKTEGMAVLKIMVGGPRFRKFPELGNQLGADGQGADADEACRLADLWFKKQTI